MKRNTTPCADWLCGQGPCKLLEKEAFEFGQPTDGAVLVAADMNPVDIPGEEMSVPYHAKRMEGNTERNNLARSETHDLFCIID